MTGRERDHCQQQSNDLTLPVYQAKHRRHSYGLISVTVQLKGEKNASEKRRFSSYSGMVQICLPAENPTDSLAAPSEGRCHKAHKGSTTSLL